MRRAPLEVRPVAAALHLIEVRTRMPLKFGTETLTCVTCARARLVVEDRSGRRAEGWGETPLSVQWVWPGALSYELRLGVLERLGAALARAWAEFDRWGHALEVGEAFTRERLSAVQREVESAGAPTPAIPRLAALAASSPYDIALHDAYGRLAGRPIYELYGRDALPADLASFLEPALDPGGAPRRGPSPLEGRHLGELLVQPPPGRLLAWHLVGGLDPLEPGDLDGSEPDDGHPVLLRDWIRRNGLRALKVKLRGTDAAWDLQRLVRVARISAEEGVSWLSADFNCTVTDPVYVNAILDRLQREQPEAYARLLYVEQPFPHELEEHPIDVRSVASRKPLFLDESAHDWRLIRLGRSLGWTGVALKTCKTQTGALLGLAWAKLHGMALMVQDLTNPMLAQVPHVLLAAHAGTIAGVETNAMQFYPDASLPEARVHPGLYRRQHGEVDLSTLAGPGFGYRIAEIHRQLPPPVVEAGR